jgi:CBS domain-containing protein
MDEIKFYMKKEVETIDCQSTVYEAAQLMEKKKIGAILATDEDEIVGIFSETDLLRKVIAKNSDPKTIGVYLVMSRPVISMDQESLMVSAFIKMQKENIRHLGITQEDKIIGIVSIRDVANYYVSKFSSK